MSDQVTRDHILHKTAIINQSFSPAAPIDSLSLFAGRRSQIEDMIGAVFQRGQHAILYGERGVGKTSLASIMHEIMEGINREDFTRCIINCTDQDDFQSIWRKAFRELSFAYRVGKIGLIEKDAVRTTNLEAVLDSICGDRLFGPEDIRYTLEANGMAFIIFDELDKLHDLTTKTLLADTIKTLSDHSVNCTILLVGIANTIDELIREHASIERALVQVHMPRMTADEIEELLDKATYACKMTIEAQAKTNIADLARGFPHYAHLLGKHSALTAIKGGRENIIAQDVQVAMRETIKQSNASIQSLYHTATISSRKNNLFSEVLLACALTDCDQLGYFSTTDVSQPLSRILGKSATINAFSQHLQDFCEPKRGPVLQRKGKPRGYKYRFINPLIVPFVIMKGQDEGLNVSGKRQLLFD